MSKHRGRVGGGDRVGATCALDRRLDRRSDVGPGWEYYLDRLGAALTGGDVAAVDFGRDYYPAMAAHYGGQAG